MKTIIFSVAFLAFSLASPYALSADHKKASTEKMGSGGDEASFSQIKTISQAQYIAGGVMSIVAPFGIGQAIQGRWLESGWIFTLSGTLIGSGVLSQFFTSSGGLIAPLWTKFVVEDEDLARATLIGLSLASMAFYIWGIADAWRLPSRYKVVKAPKFQVSPLYIASYKERSTAGLGLSFKYKF